VPCNSEIKESSLSRRHCEETRNDAAVAAVRSQSTGPLCIWRLNGSQADQNEPVARNICILRPVPKGSNRMLLEASCGNSSPPV